MANDLLSIKYTAKALFDAVPIEPHPEFGPIGIGHPYTETAFVANPNKEGKLDFVNLLEDEDGFKAWRKWWFERIDAAPSATKLMHYVCKAYRLTFLKHIQTFIDNDTFSEPLAHAWVCSENPNMDANCSREEMVKWFKRANKEKLMDKEEYKYWKSLPEQFEVYRGVATGRIEHGLSWTRSLDTAEWFASRWGNDGHMLKATIKKKHALAYFNSRDEDEIVVDVFAIKNNIKKM